MSDGDDEPAEDADDVTPDSLGDRLDAVEAELDEAETEADLDAVEADLDAVAADIEEADLPAPDEDDEDAEDPREELESRVESLREDLEAARGPYAEDVVEGIESAQATLRETRWTETGREEIQAAVASFLDAAGDALEESFAGGEGDATDVRQAVAGVDGEPAGFEVEQRWPLRVGVLRDHVQFDFVVRSQVPRDLVDVGGGVAVEGVDLRRPWLLLGRDRAPGAEGQDGSGAEQSHHCPPVETVALDQSQ